MQRKKYYIIIILCLLGGSFLVMFFKNKNYVLLENIRTEQPIVNSETKPSIPESNSVKELKPFSPAAISQKIQQTVPFIVQAPFANWKDIDFQNGCEEASIVMAMGWINGEKTISPTEAKKRILEIIAFENKTLGYSADTDVTDIEKIFRQYYKYENIKVAKNISIEDIKNELQKGNLVLVPAFGRALKNPNFTQPGPITHMLVIIGYDPVAKEFITNDPGTRNGAGYRYGENVFFSAIWEYSSGKEPPSIPNSETMPKAMISVGK